MSSASEEEVEKFEITDYDYENEFNIDRPRRKQTKEEAIYGSFGTADSDDEWDSRPSFGKSNSKGGQYGINFISGGVKKTAEQEAADSSKADADEDEGNVDPLLQTQFGRRKESSRSQRKAYKAADKSGSMGIGDWEKSTNKIGSTLLMKMGWKPGQGVGKDGRGIATPVEAKVRLGKGAIGFYGTERTEQSLKDYPVKDEEAEEDTKFKEQLNQWKRTESGKVKPTYVYKTADELIAKGIKRKTKEASSSKYSNVKVIDMTGREKRVLSGYHAISAKKHDSDEEIVTEEAERKAFDMPELLHNVNMLIDMTEEEIITRDRQLRYERDMAVNIQHEFERLETLCAQEEQQINRLNEVLSLINTFEQRTQPNCPRPLGLDECAELFLKLQDEYYEEYKAYDLITVSIAVVFPLVQKYFSNWQPLSNPKFGCDVMSKWKAILDIDRRHGDSTANHNAYSKLIWDVLMPHIRTTISLWNVRNADALIEVLEAWMPLIPQWMFQNILDQLVNPKLQMEVDKWNPLTDTVPIHAWLHPWLPLMGQRLEPLYAPIRHKLSSALNKWHPSDISAKLMLKPWLNVFSAGHTEAFLLKNIVPKLAICLQEMPINPSNQSLENWNWVMSWQDILADQVLVNLLTQYFFPRWLQTLTSWLNTSPNYEEIGSWYKGWKGVIPERLITHPTIKEKLGVALNIMNRSVTNPSSMVSVPPVSAAAVPPSLYASANRGSMSDFRKVVSTPPPPPPPPIPDSRKKPDSSTSHSNPSIPHSFKDLVAMKAAENNLEFYPLPGKFQEGHQVYQCGRSQITIDRGVIFIQSSNLWTPISLNQLFSHLTE